MNNELSEPGLGINGTIFLATNMKGFVKLFDTTAGSDLVPQFVCRTACFLLYFSYPHNWLDSTANKLRFLMSFASMTP